MLGTGGSFVLPSFAAAAIFWVTSARAQIDLPPPPPPPLGEPGESPPPPPPAPSGPPEVPRRPATRIPRSRPTPEAHAEAPQPASPEPEPPRTAAVTWNPAGIGWGRLSANVEVQFAPHHSFVASPNALVLHVDRGSGRDLLSEGFGFASPTSFSLGGELGYHYWLSGLSPLSGPYFGPSLVFGATTHANVGNASQAQGYWGLAFDLGAARVFAGGFTVGGGAGLELARMATVTALIPRLLAQVGWSF